MASIKYPAVTSDVAEDDRPNLLNVQSLFVGGFREVAA
jgi:hypothetical protein